MKTSFPINRRMETNNYPYPIAHAWRLANDNQYGATVRHINAIGCFYQCLRLSAIALAGWYLYRLPKNPSLDTALQTLQRPMMGQWLYFIRKALSKVYLPENSDSFLPLIKLVDALHVLESERWPITKLAPNPLPDLRIGELPSNKRPAEVSLTPLAWFIQHRNTHHGHFATLTDKEVAKVLDEILPKLNTILEYLECFTEYQLVYHTRGSNLFTILHGDEFQDFKSLSMAKPEIFDGIGFENDEQVALIYPDSELVIPLTHLITREQPDDDFEGIVKFRTATIKQEPLIYEGIDDQKQSVVYLGSGTRNLRKSSYAIVKELFDSHIKSEENTGLIDAVDHLRYNAENQLSTLYGVKYQPHTYVNREIEKNIRSELLNTPNSAERPAVLLIGNSGTGKTSLLCHFAEGLIQGTENKHQISLRLAETLGDGITPNLEIGLAADLGYRGHGSGYDINDLLEYWAEANKKRDTRKPFLWIIWDALNEGNNLETLIKWAGEAAKKINEWNNKSVYGQVRLIVSCRLEPWEMLTAKYQTTIPGEWPLPNSECFRWSKDKTGRRVPYWTLPKFSVKEAQQAYVNYAKWAILSFARHSTFSWADLGKETQRIVQVPINCWLFHNVSSVKAGLPLGSLSTSHLWREYLIHHVVKHTPALRAIELFSHLMWENGSSNLSTDVIVECSRQDSNKRLDTYLSSLGLNYSIFSALPLDAQNKLLEGNSGLLDVPSPLELLHVAGMLIIKQNGMVSFVYQTLSEAVIEWTLWRQLLPRWNPLSCHEEESFDFTLCEAQKTGSIKLDEIIEPWLNKAVWDDGRNALIKVRAIRAENALQNAFYNEALKNLKDLQIRGCSGLVLDIIEANIEKVSNEEVKRQLFSIEVDMVHLRGQYKEAADMIGKEMTGLADAKIFVDEWLISQLIRLVHHQMFFSPISTLCERIKEAIGKVDANVFPRVYGELLFMLGGNLGTLSGEYGESRSYLLKAISIGKKCNDDYLVCRSLRKYADFLRHRNHLMLASNVWQMAWELSEKYQGTRQGIYLLCTMGDLKRQMGNYDESGKYFQRSLELAKQSNIMGWVGHCYLGLAELSLELNDLPSADNYCQLALNCYETIEQQWGKIQVSICRARIAILQRDKSWKEHATAALEDSLRFGYKRDYEFACNILEKESSIKNILMFL